MESEPITLCYVGAGGFSNACIYPQLAAHPVRLLGVCDLVEERAQAAARRYGFERVYTDFRTMLETQQPEAVICVGGPQVHYEVGREVLARGLPLYIQKSPAPDVAATRELAALAAAHGVPCHVGFNLRSSVAGRQARECLAEPGFGPTTLVMVRYGLVSGATLRDAVMDQHCHAFDLLRWLGGEVEELVIQRGRVEGNRGYVGAVRFASGAVGSINFTSHQTSTREFLYFEATGSNGHYLTSHDFDLLVRRPEGDRTWTMGTYGGALGPLAWMGYVADLAGFLSAVRGGPDPAPVADTVATMELCEEAYRQLREQGAQP